MKHKLGLAPTDDGVEADADRGVEADADRGVEADADRGVEADADCRVEVDADRGVEADADRGVEADADRGVEADADRGSRPMLIVGNWKLFKGPREAGEFGGELRERLGGLAGVAAAVCPPFVSLSAAVDALGGSGVAVYAQNVHWAGEGAFTGEVSAAMLQELGVQGALVGHSERRQYFGETDEGVARRAAAGLEEGLRVIACVGESEEERQSGQTEFVLRFQVEALADSVGPHEGLAIAYEPVWAIGTGRTATPEQVQGAHAFIRSLLDVPLLYGGSVKPENAGELLSQPDVDGALVGGASLDVDSFAAICETAARIRS